MSKKFLLVFIFLFVLGFVIFSINATVNMRTSSLTNQSNHTGTIANITCNVNLAGAEIVNMTFWYNASAHTGISAVTTEMLAYVENQSAAQSNNFSILNVDVSSLADSDTYTIWCEAQNDTGTLSQNSSYYNVTNITIDNTAPAITIHTSYSNATAKKNTTDLTLNVSVVDTIWLLDGAYCFFNINGTNETVAVERNAGSVTSGWCNTSHLNLTGMSDGNAVIHVWINDSLGNIGHNYTRYVQTDTTVPGASALCTPSSVVEGSIVTCTCSGSDVTSGVNSSTADSTPSTLDEGGFTYTCTVVDNAGNSASDTATYTVLDSAGTSPGSGPSGSTTKWATGTTITGEKLEVGYTQSLGAKHRIRFQLESESHHVGILSIDNQKATIEIASNPVQIILSVGEDARVDVTGNNFYDLYVLLNGMVDGKANVTIKQIHQEILEGEEVDTSGEIIRGGESEEQETEIGNKFWIWIIIVLLILAAAAKGGKMFNRKKK